MLLGVDVGGTFTDAVLIAEGGAAVYTAKVPSTPEEQSRGVLEAVRAVLERAGARAGEVERFAHGMTVATNALLELSESHPGTGGRPITALIATEGFTDVVALGRQARAHLYRLCEARPAPLAPAELRFGAPERMTPDGPLRALDPQAARALVEKLAHAGRTERAGTEQAGTERAGQGGATTERAGREQAGQGGIEAVAVALLHSYAHPEHERLLGELIAERLPAVHVSLSHELVGTFREYERAATTEVDAALSPLLGAYLRRLGAQADALGLARPAVMQSSGGLIDAEGAAAHGALTALSGPAGGVRGALLLAELAGERDVLCFDMGGTSCDVCLIEGGRVAETAEGVVAGRPLALAMLDIHTVGAGGGSIAWRDPGGALRVGPTPRAPTPARRATGAVGSSPPSPTPTCCWGAYRQTPRSRGACSSTATPRSARWESSPRSSASPRMTPPAPTEAGRHAPPTEAGRHAPAARILVSANRHPTSCPCLQGPCAALRASCGSRRPRCCGRCARSPSSAASTRAASR
jgi:N-methylhydantoinase A